MGMQPLREGPFVVGKCYFIKAVISLNVGKVDDIRGKFLVLKNCACIEAVGTYDEFTHGAMPSLYHSHPEDQEVFVNMDAIVDAFEVEKPLPYQSPVKAKA